MRAIPSAEMTPMRLEPDPGGRVLTRREDLERPASRGSSGWPESGSRPDIGGVYIMAWQVLIVTVASNADSDINPQALYQW
jgi:hypothetical protein